MSKTGDVLQLNIIKAQSGCDPAFIIQDKVADLKLSLAG